jgi:hypothetical protein
VRRLSIKTIIFTGAKMNEQEYQMALIEAKQEALNWQEKYMQQRDANAKQSEKIVRQTTRIAELEELYKGVRSKENEKRVESLANQLSRMLESQLANFTRIKESSAILIEEFKKG